MYLFGFIFLFCGFSRFLYFLRNKFTLVSQTFSWVFAMLSQTDALQGASTLHMEGFEAIVMFRG